MVTDSMTDVLIVEDHQELAQLLQRFLIAENYTVRHDAARHGWVCGLPQNPR